MKFTLLLVLAAGFAAAQKTNWANLKALPVGGEIRVSLNSGRSFRGQMQNVTDESLIIVAAASQETLARAEVAKVATRSDSHRLRNTLIGLGVGAGGGLAIGAGIDHGTCSTCFFKNDNVGKIIFTPLGAVVGTIVGLAWPTGTWHEIYRSK
jgi:hypothetical protein